LLRRKKDGEDANFQKEGLRVKILGGKKFIILVKDIINRTWEGPWPWEG